jgi:hypothetical protein
VKLKRWVAYERRRGQVQRPLFLVEAETEREALCLASDAALHRQAMTAPDQPARPWAGPIVHVRDAAEVPDADVAVIERFLALAN